MKNSLGKKCNRQKSRKDSLVEDLKLLERRVLYKKKKIKGKYGFRCPGKDLRKPLWKALDMESLHKREPFLKKYMKKKEKKSKVMPIYSVGLYLQLPNQVPNTEPIDLKYQKTDITHELKICSIKISRPIRNLSR